MSARRRKKDREAIRWNSEMRLLQQGRDMRLASLRSRKIGTLTAEPQSLLNEGRRCPDFIEAVELLRPYGRVAWKFPGRRHDVVSLRKEASLSFFDLAQCGLDLVAVEVEYSNPVGDRVNLAMLHFYDDSLLRQVPVNVVDRCFDCVGSQRAPDRAYMFRSSDGFEGIFDQRDLRQGARGGDRAAMPKPVADLFVSSSKDLCGPCCRCGGSPLRSEARVPG